MGNVAVATVPGHAGIVDDRSDAELLDDVQKGKTESFGALYERHRESAYRLARQLGRNQVYWDELVSIAFVRVLDAVLNGTKPKSFRAYLLTALRHTAYDDTRRGRKCEFVEDITAAPGIRGDSLTTPFFDTVVADCDKSLAAHAFARLPERWQAVLWHTEVEGRSAAEVAPILGLTPNGVSALAYRAREGLRQAYLQVHLAETTAACCRATADRLGAWTREGLYKRERAQVEKHLDECDDCRDRLSYLIDVNSQLR